MGVSPSGFFVLRTPLLAVDELARWAASGDRDELAALVARPEVREALWLASPSLDAGLDVWRQAPESDAGRKVERAVVRYVTRMATRPTPFGLFAGTSVGTLGTATALALPPRTASRRHARLDTDHVARLCDALAPTLRDEVRLRPNSSLYRAAGRLRFAARVEDAARSYALVAVEPTEYLEATLARAHDGARRGDLARALIGGDITEADALAFIDQVTATQLLIPLLEPPLTGDDPLHELVAQLAGVAGAPTPALTAVAGDLAAIERAPLGELAPYRALARSLEQLPATVDPARMVQIDLIKPAPGLALTTAVVDEVAAVVERLRLISPRPADTALDRFRDAFVARYEEREVPLNEALDSEAGVGLPGSRGPGLDPSPLLDGLPFPAPAGSTEVAWTAATRHLARRVARCLESGERELVLDDDDWRALAAPTPVDLPDAFAIYGALFATSPAAVDAGDFRFRFDTTTGPSGANLLGRFGHVPALRGHIAAHLRAEEAADPGAIYAEIVHLPPGRLGNLCVRPVLRAYEIPFLGRSGAPADHQIPVDDLLVSVRRGELVLRSRRLEREVRPRLTTAHDFRERSLPHYYFLCALAYRRRPPIAWSFGPLDALPHLPAVRAGRIVVSPERWRLAARELHGLDAARVHALRAALGWPRWIGLIDGENVLPVDLDNPLAVDSFIALARGRDALDLRATDLDALPVTGPEGRFVHDLVIPMIRTPAPATAPAPAAIPRVTTPIARQFPPGSAWWYGKLYTGEATADHVLAEVVAPLVRDEPRWFFLRYADPAWHVRVRIHGDPARLAELGPRLAEAIAPWLADGRLIRVQLDTYEREVERYGGPHGIELAEGVFCADSAAALAIVGMLDDSGGLDVRWRLALRGIDQLLDDLGLGLADKLAVIAGQRDAFAREHAVDAPLARAISDRYRRERPALEGLLDRAHDADTELAPALAAFAERSLAIAPIAAELSARARDGRLTRPLPELAASFAHMHANRLLRSSARAQELVIYDLLARLYQSRRARSR